MKKRNIILSVLLVLVAASSIYVGSTYAKYVSTFTGSTAIEVAKWNVAVDGVTLSATPTVDQTLECTFAPAAVDTVVSGKVAPGRVCYVDVTINPDDTEVAVDYAVTFGTPAVGTIPTNMSASAKVSTGTTFNTTTNTDATLTQGVTTGTISLVDSDTALSENEAITIRYALAWPFETEDGDDEDTTDGITAASLTIPVSVTLAQHVVE